MSVVQWRSKWQMAGIDFHLFSCSSPLYTPGLSPFAFLVIYPFTFAHFILLLLFFAVIQLSSHLSLISHSLQAASIRRLTLTHTHIHTHMHLYLLSAYAPDCNPAPQRWIKEKGVMMACRHTGRGE